MRDGSSFHLNATLDAAAVILQHRYVCSHCVSTCANTSSAFLDLRSYLLHLFEHHDVTVRHSADTESDDDVTRRLNDAQYEKRADALVCNSCELETTCTDAFAEHLRCHLVEHPYACSACEQDFSTPLLYNEHTKGIET